MRAIENKSGLSGLDSGSVTRTCEGFIRSDEAWLDTLALPIAVRLEVGARFHERTCNLLSAAGLSHASIEL